MQWFVCIGGCASVLWFIGESLHAVAESATVLQRQQLIFIKKTHFSGLAAVTEERNDRKWKGKNERLSLRFKCCSDYLQVLVIVFSVTELWGFVQCRYSWCILLLHTLPKICNHMWRHSCSKGAFNKDWMGTVFLSFTCISQINGLEAPVIVIILLFHVIHNVAGKQWWGTCCLISFYMAAMSCTTYL